MNSGKYLIHSKICDVYVPIQWQRATVVRSPERQIFNLATFPDLPKTIPPVITPYFFPQKEREGSTVTATHVFALPFYTCWRRLPDFFPQA